MVPQWKVGDYWNYRCEEYGIDYVVAGRQEKAEQQFNLTFGFIYRGRTIVDCTFFRTSVEDLGLFAGDQVVAVIAPENLEIGSVTSIRSEHSRWQLEFRILSKQLLRSRVGEKVCFLIEVSEVTSDEPRSQNLTHYWYSPEVKSHVRIKDRSSMIDLVNYGNLNQGDIDHLVDRVLSNMVFSEDPSRRLRVIQSISELKHFLYQTNMQSSIYFESEMLLRRLESDPIPYVKERAKTALSQAGSG